MQFLTLYQPPYESRLFRAFGASTIVAMHESVYYKPLADVQKTGVEDAASRPRFRTFSASALNFHNN